MKMKKSCFVTIPLLVLLLLAAGFKIYTSGYYRTDPALLQKLQEDQRVTLTETSDLCVLTPADQTPSTGLIFYPGGKVEFTAYEPLLYQIAEQGILCLLPRMPENLAFFDIHAAEKLREDYPEITSWYLGGHSLGGVAAAMDLSEYADNYEGLILCASYTTKDLSDTSLRLLSLYGSEDQVLNLEQYEKNRSNWPKDSSEIILPGGVHAYFGSYGHQKGDGTPAITNEEQLEQSAAAIISWIQEQELALDAAT